MTAPSPDPVPPGPVNHTTRSENKRKPAHGIVRSGKIPPFHFLPGSQESRETSARNVGITIASEMVNYLLDVKNLTEETAIPAVHNSIRYRFIDLVEGLSSQGEVDALVEGAVETVLKALSSMKK